MAGLVPIWSAVEFEPLIIARKSSLLRNPPELRVIDGLWVVVHGAPYHGEDIHFILVPPSRVEEMSF